MRKETWLKAVRSGHSSGQTEGGRGTRSLSVMTVSNNAGGMIAGALERIVVLFERVRREQLRRLHLNAESAYLLRLAARPAGVRLSAYREQVGIPNARASQIVRPLASTGQVTVRRDRDDGRAKIIEITEPGRKTLAELDAAVERALVLDLGEPASGTSDFRKDMARLYQAVKPPRKRIVTKKAKSLGRENS